MKKRLLIICSIIGVLLAGFQFSIYAEETAPDYSSSTSIITSTALDQYFYDNYELLPYIESNGSQYIDTNINATNNLRILFIGGGFTHNDSNQFLFGSREREDNLAVYLKPSGSSDNGSIFSTAYYNFIYDFPFYDSVNILFDKNNLFLNGSSIHSFTNNEFNIHSIYIFGINENQSGAKNLSSYKLYRFSIYDYAANEDEGALVRDYYPARSKSGGIIGLYDAVSKTFVTTSGSVPFASPTGDPVNLSLGANITQFLSGSLSWIGAIFEGINEMPIIWVFIAIALAGVMFRWARRIVHF